MILQPKRKVLHLIEGLGSGGAERLLYTNLENIDRSEFDHEVVTVFSERDFWKKPIEELGIPVGTLKCKSQRSVSYNARRLRQRIREHRPDLIHTHLWAANVVGRVAGGREGVPVISSVHSPEYEKETNRDSSAKGRIWNSIAQMIDRYTARRWCTRIIAVSEFVKRSTAARLKYPSEKIDVLYNPVQLGETADAGAGDHPFRDEGVQANAKVLLVVGRVAPQKGMIYAVRAMPEILSKEPNAHLALIGSSNDKNYLSSLNAEIDRLKLNESVHLIGERRNVTPYLAACDVFLFPSVFEGMGIALAEAMWHGCACAVSRIQPFDEFIEDGVSGVYFESRDPADLAAKVVMLLQDAELRSRLGDEAANVAKTKFDPQKAAKELADLYRKVLAE
jgi:glycosyltransferase involved in cell wall biosynthesis